MLSEPYSERAVRANEHLQVTVKIGAYDVDPMFDEHREHARGRVSESVPFASTDHRQ